MDNNTEKKDMTPEEMDQAFKDALFNVFSSKMPGVHYDEDGLIVVPVPVRRKAPENSGNDKQEY